MPILSACLAVIPARWASSRLPGKPLADIGGKAMIQRVWEQAAKARPERLVVATDDERILHAVEAFGGEALLTHPDCPSGTDRCAEVAERLQWPEAGVVLNVQGDEPFLDPNVLERLHASFTDPSVEIATVAVPLRDRAAFENPNTPKVVLDNQGNALYFSRHPIPHGQNWPEADAARAFAHPWRHIGAYAFRRSTLRILASLPPSSLERAERLEQLRWLENAWPIRVLALESAGVTVDTPADLEAARKLAGDLACN